MMRMTFRNQAGGQTGLIGDVLSWVGIGIAAVIAISLYRSAMAENAAKTDEVRRDE
jgi:uncharacterized membrane protein required for colicin V production